MTVLCVSTASGDANLLRQQILTYNKCFDNDIFHAIHLSEEFNEYLYVNPSERKLLLDIGNVHLFNRVKTAYGVIFHAMLQSVLEALRIGVKFDYVFFHTSSDLMVKRGANKYIRMYDIGAAKPHFLNSNGIWYEKAINFKKADALLSSLGSDKRYKARAEGCFFKREIFFELIYPLLTHYGSIEFNDLARHPVEEVEFAWAIEFFCARNSIKRVDNLVKTLVGRKRIALLEDVESVAREDGVFGLKRFSSDRFDAARSYIFDSIGLNKSDL
ncbi:hypothetical protein [Microbulbifer variabilis]|uniref:hypothetical protein n=1 Tax=Microbulbifer variabilis TaxID=266805 RepID=UPI001CFC5FC6|nr:hypothetical protein [Microbulbifer variabilis]